MDTIKSSSEISKVFDEGRRLPASAITLIALRKENHHDPQGRVAFIAGKRLGNAVWRNRAKRRMREVCRKVGAPMDSYDILFVARRKVTDVSFDRLVSQVGQALAKLG